MKKYSKHIKIKIIICFLVLFILSGMIYLINRKIEPQLKAFARQQVSLAIHHVISSVMEKMEYDSSDLVQMTFDTEGNIVTLDYNTKLLNKILYQTIDSIHLSLSAAENGEKDPKLDKIFFEKGIVYEVPVGYFFHSNLLSTKGPLLKVRMRSLNDVTGEIKIKSEPYGYNSTMIKIMLDLQLHASVITALSMEDIAVHKELPIVIQVVPGKLPNYLINKKEP